ncbi:RhoGEF domain [Balamuthia mandrillaris]
MKLRKETRVGKTFFKPELLELSRWLLTSEARSLAVRTPPQQWASAAQNQFPQVVCSALIEEATHMERTLGPRFQMAVKQGGLDLLGIKGVRRHLASPLADFLSPLLWQLFPLHTTRPPCKKSNAKPTTETKVRVDVVDMRVFRYSAEEPFGSHHPLHIDQGATLTVNVCLGPATSICRGADLFFLDPMTGQPILRLSPSPLFPADEAKQQKANEKEEHTVDVGYAVLHVADLPNATTDISQGERFHLIIRMKSYLQANAFCMFSHLSNELQSYVLSFLTVEELLCARAISRHWRELIEDNPSLWRRHLPERMGEAVVENGDEMKDSKETERERTTWAKRYITRAQEQRKASTAAHYDKYTGPNFPPKESRMHIINELITTEAYYFSQLHCIIYRYLKPLQAAAAEDKDRTAAEKKTKKKEKAEKKKKKKKKKNKKKNKNKNNNNKNNNNNNQDVLLPAKLLPKLFGNVETVWRLHRELYRQLLLAEHACQVCSGLRKRDAEPDISSVLERFIPLFAPIYAPYSIFHMHAMQHLDFAKQTYPKFAEFLTEQRKKNKLNLGLEACLIMPISRVPRYTIWLERLHRLYQLEGEEGHEEEVQRAQVQTALQKVEQACRDIDSEVTRRLREFQPRS